MTDKTGCATVCGVFAGKLLATPSLFHLKHLSLCPLHCVYLQVKVPSLTMGTCSSLLGVELSSKGMAHLDVRGCGALQQLHLDCPQLQVLDATFCGNLGDEGLAGAVASSPPLRKLALSVCCQVGGCGGTHLFLGGPQPADSVPNPGALVVQEAAQQQSVLFLVASGLRTA